MGLQFEREGGRLVYCQMNSSNTAMSHLIGSLTVVLPFTAQMSTGDLQLGAGGKDRRVATLRVIIVPPPENKK